MNKTIRIVMVLAGMAAIVAASMSRTAWADKLSAGAQAPASSGLSQQEPVGSRPQGTVITTPECIKTLVPGTFTVGSIAEWFLDDVSGGKQYEACVAKESDLPKAVPGVLLSAPIKLIVHTDEAMTVSQRVCFPVPPGRTGSAYFWDGKAWAETEEAKDGNACVTVPADAPAPTFVGICEEP